MANPERGGGEGSVTCLMNGSDAEAWMEKKKEESERRSRRRRRRKTGRNKIQILIIPISI